MPLKVKSPSRRSDRIYTRLPITLLVPSTSRKITHNACAVDLSQSGARVRTTIPLWPGQQVDIVPSEGLKEIIPSRVIWVDQTNADRASEAGLQFLERLQVMS